MLTHLRYSPLLHKGSNLTCLAYSSPTENSHRHLKHTWFWFTTDFGQYVHGIFKWVTNMATLKDAMALSSCILDWPLHTTSWRAMQFWKTPLPLPRVRREYNHCFRHSTALLFGCKLYDIAGALSTMTVAGFWAQEKAFKHLSFVYEPQFYCESYLEVLYYQKDAIVPGIYKWICSLL